MSADTLIPDPYDTQAYNRYSYVKNNPLKYTDPSGHSWFWDKIDKISGAIMIAIGVLATLIPNPITIFIGITLIANGIKHYNYNPDQPYGPQNNKDFTIPSMNLYTFSTDEISSETHQLATIEKLKATESYRYLFDNGSGDVYIENERRHYTPNSQAVKNSRQAELNARVEYLGRSDSPLSPKVKEAIRNHTFTYVDDPRNIFHDGNYYSGGKHDKKHGNGVDISAIAFHKRYVPNFGNLILSPNESLDYVIIHEANHYGNYRPDGTYDPLRYKGLLGPRSLIGGFPHAHPYHDKINIEFLRLYPNKRDDLSLSYF